LTYTKDALKNNNYELLISL